MFWIDLGFMGYIRITTVLTALLLFFYALYRTRKPITAFLAMMAWASLYEIIWLLTDMLMHNQPVTNVFWISAALTAWPLLAYTRDIKPERLFLFVFAITWMIWILTGFNGNHRGVEPYSWTNEAIYVSTKSLIALAYAPFKNSRSLLP